MRRSSSSAAALPSALIRSSSRAVHRAAARPASRRPDAAVLGDAQRAVVLAAVLAEVAQADHRELEALGAVDGHHAHGVDVLGLERSLALARLEHVALGHGVDEAAQVAALVGLELARHAHQLAHVGHAPLAAGQREQVAVVARGGDRAVDQRLERHLAGDAGARPRSGSTKAAASRSPVARPAAGSSQLLARLAHEPPRVARSSGARAGR